MQFDILTSAEAREKNADDWRCLADSCGHGIFGGYEWHMLWWKHLGSTAAVTLHIVTMRDGSGKLTAVLPLIVRHSYGARIAEWAGYEVFDYGDVLAVTSPDAEAILNYAYLKGRYDIALLKDVHYAALSMPYLSRVMRLRRQKKNYFLTLDFVSGEAWLAAQSRKLRGDVRRKMEKMAIKGAVTFHVHDNAKPVPVSVINALYDQKKEWFAANNKRGVFARPEVQRFLHELAQDASRRGTLYLAWLSCGDSIAACHMGFVQGGVLYLYHTTYDTAYRAFSPGNSMMVETIKWTIDVGLSELDFMRGEESYKARFASGVRQLSTYMQGRSWLGKLGVVLQKEQGETEETPAELEESPT